MPTATFDAQRWEDMLIAITDRLRTALVEGAAQALAQYGRGTERYAAIGLTNTLGALYRIDDVAERLRALPAEDVLALADIFQGTHRHADRGEPPSSAERYEVDRLMKSAFNIDPAPSIPLGTLGTAVPVEPVPGALPPELVAALQAIGALGPEQRAAFLREMRTIFGAPATAPIGG